MSAFLDSVRFNAASTGTGDFVVASAVAGALTPAGASAVNGRSYKYRAESGDRTQWEVGITFYNSSATSFPRVSTQVLFNSAGTGTAQGGAGALINFTVVPIVSVIALKEDLISIEEANSFTAAQTLQARANIAAAGIPTNWTFTLLTSGSGTYTTKANCKAILVEGRGGGAGGGNTPGGGGCSGGSQGGRFLSFIAGPAASYSYAVGAGGAAGAAGGNTTFGAMTANSGSPGNQTTVGQAGGTASGGNLLNIRGAPGGSPMFAGSPYYGGPGGGEGGGFGAAGQYGGTAPANSGAGGGGAPSDTTYGGGSGGSGYIYIIEFY